MTETQAPIHSCLVCRKQRGITPPPGGILYEDELVFASHSFIPQDQENTYLGILFLEPKRHIAGLEELSPEEGAHMGSAAARLSRALQLATDAEHIYLFVLGHHVDHLHFWIIPRYIGTPREYWGLQVEEWPDAPRGAEQEIGVLCDTIRS